jgi:hypothetical protein
MTDSLHKSLEAQFHAEEDDHGATTNTDDDESPPQCRNGNIQSKESGWHDANIEESSTSSSDDTDDSVGVELVEDFRVVEKDDDDLLEQTLRSQGEHSLQTIFRIERNETDAAIDLWNGSSNAIPFDQNSMSTIGC